MNTPAPPKRPDLKRHGPKVSSAEAQARLADALRENLRRRKAQLRARDQKEAAVDKSVADAAEDAGDKTR